MSPTPSPHPDAHPSPPPSSPPTLPNVLLSNPDTSRPSSPRLAPFSDHAWRDPLSPTPHSTPSLHPISSSSPHCSSRNLSHHSQPPSPRSHSRSRSRSPPTSNLPMSRRPSYWHQDLSTLSLLYLLCFISFTTGLIDAAAYAAFQTFASNMTGNVVIVTIEIAGYVTPSSGYSEDIQGIQLSYNGTALLGYLVTGYITGLFAHRLGRRVRAWLVAGNIFQVICISVGLGITWAHLIDESHWVLLLLLSIASGAQVGIARTVGVAEMPTAMLSSPMIDLLVDPNLFLWSFKDPRVKARNRRVAYIASLVVGSFAGAIVHRVAGVEVVILVALVVKFVITVGFVLAPCEKNGGQQEEEEKRVGKNNRGGEGEGEGERLGEVEKGMDRIKMSESDNGNSNSNGHRRIQDENSFVNRRDRRIQHGVASG